jgi:hypothetical protein
MAGLLSAAMLAELRASSKTVIPILRLFFTAGTRSYDQVGQSSTTLGTIYGKVVTWGPISRVVSDRENQLTLSTCTVVISDTDAEFSSMLEDSNAGSLRGARALIQLTSPNVAPAGWTTLFDGYLEKWQMTALFQWTLTLHPNDQPLVNKSFPKTPILAIDWPNVADKSVYGEFVPVHYGIHDSRGSTDMGMVPCPYVDRLGGRFLVQHGWAKDVPRVYDDSSGAFALKSTSLYTITHPTINGRLFTLIDYVTPPAVTVQVRADVEGCEATGDGSGATLTGADCLKHALVNFVYGDYQGGNWASVGSVPVSASAFTTAQSFLTDMGWQKVSRRFGGTVQTTGMQLIGDFCRSLQLSAFFTRDGLIAVAAEDHRVTTQWYDEPRWLRYDLHEVGDTFRPDYDRGSIIDRLTVSYIYNSAEEKFVQVLEVRDTSITEQNADALELLWSNASLA